MGATFSRVHDLLVSTAQSPSRLLVVLRGNGPPPVVPMWANTKNPKAKRPLPPVGTASARPAKQSKPAPLASSKVANRPKICAKKKAVVGALVVPDILPAPGTVCKNMASYSTLNNETLTGVAAKLGTDWKAMAAMKQNKARYGALKGSTKFQRNTLLAIPKAYSRWKMKQLLPAVEEEREECVDCGVEDNPAQMLLCDGCDACHHVACVGLAAVPSGDWFCSSCLEILRARKAHNQSDPYKLDALPELVLSSDCNLSLLRKRLRVYLKDRRPRQLEAQYGRCGVSESGERAASRGSWPVGSDTGHERGRAMFHPTCPQSVWRRSILRNHLHRWVD